MTDDRRDMWVNCKQCGYEWFADERDEYADDVDIAAAAIRAQGDKT